MLDKSKLLTIALQQIEEKITTLQLAFDDLQASLIGATKSSAGDKHETGRAMTQLEQEKLSKQLTNICEQRNRLKQIESDKINDKAVFGSIVETSNGIFFLSVSIGRISCENKEVFCISPSAPIGQLLLDKGKGDVVNFNNQRIELLRVY